MHQHSQSKDLDEDDAISLYARGIWAFEKTSQEDNTLFTKF